uniref:Uncharacterized protein n=1 Tax=Bracoviriform glomeratae TaxID=257816 RepID=Q6S373_9VIRU|nr:hypothetical protein 1 [Bracoviriform glomeratae]
MSGIPHFTVKTPPVFTKIQNLSACLPLGNPVSIFTESIIYLRYLIIESMNNMLFCISVHDVEASLLQADLSKPLSKIGRSTNHMLQVRERCLPSEPKHQELR